MTRRANLEHRETQVIADEHGPPVRPLLRGTAPADTPLATAGRILTQPPDLTGVPGPLLDLVSAALSKEPGDRPTAPQLLGSLLTAHGDLSGELDRRPELREAAAMSARHTSRMVVLRRRGKRALISGVVLALAASTVGMVVHLDGVARDRASAAGFRDDRVRLVKLGSRC